MDVTGDSRMKRVMSFTLLCACVAILTIYSYTTSREPSVAPDRKIMLIFGPLTGNEMASYLRNLPEQQKTSLPNYSQKLARALNIGDRPFVEAHLAWIRDSSPASKSLDASTPTAMNIEHAAVATP